jgi:adenosylcobinamide kinase / adenosylcobinamide-phosphate guanylyltransferase
MRVRLLGTGSADGWPNAFCDCASCQSARRSGNVRVPTSALVDDRILLDCGPESPRAALRHGTSLASVTHILITHDHPDHSAPMALLARSWARRVEPITIVGPAPVIASWSSWADPTDPVRWRVVMAGDTLTIDGYTVAVLDAAHGDVEGVVYDLTGPDQTRLLYATDTGPLPAPTVRAMTGAAYDLILLEATFGDRLGPGQPQGTDHLDLRTFGDQLVRLRHAGAITSKTRISPIHLSHHSPPDLAERLAGWGSVVVDDGYEFRLDGSDSPTPTAPNDPRRTLILGGARSGKSRAAEHLLHTSAITYIATGMVPDGTDTDWSDRVNRHQSRRPAAWTTIESTDVAGLLLHATQPVLVDCLGMWLTAVMTDSGAWRNAAGWQSEVDHKVDELVDAWHRAPVPVIAVSNEVGSGVVPGTTSGRLFRDRLGIVNTRLSVASERVLLVVAGRALDLAAMGS